MVVPTQNDMQLNFILLQDRNLVPLEKVPTTKQKYSHHKYNDHKVTYWILTDKKIKTSQLHTVLHAQAHTCTSTEHTSPNFHLPQ